MIKTVIFDMDGVIVDTEPLHKFAYFKHFEEMNIVVSEEMYSTFTGNSTKNVYQKIIDHFSLHEDVNDLVMRKRAIFNDAFDYSDSLYLLSGVLDLIVNLHENNIQLILASSASKGTIERVFKRFKLYPYFEHLVSGEDFVKSKPDPAIFIHAAKISGHLSTECLVIEDSTNGVVAAKDANLFCIGYDSVHSKSQDLSRANILISNFDELNAALVEVINE